MYSERQHGMTYLWALFLVFLLGLGLGKSLEVYSVQLQRAKEAELLAVGHLYREALRQYYVSSPGTVRKYPERLEDLLRDPRYLTTRRYLRRLYPDPVTGEAFVALTAPEGGIQGVRSASDALPRKQDGFIAADSDFRRQLHYGDWRFVAGPTP